MRPFARWLRHRSRVPRKLRAALAVALGAVAIVGAAAGQGAPASSSSANGSGSSSAPQPGPTPDRIVASPTKSPDPPGPGNLTAHFPSSRAMLAQGYELYEQNCSACHGDMLQGKKGIAPSLIGVGAGPVDFYLSTGRMPLQNQTDEPLRTAPLFDREQIDSIVDYVGSFGPAAPRAEPAHGSLAYGLHVFTLDCSGCHQVVGRGGITIGAQIPRLTSATAQQIAEAVRFGPYLMPHFDSREISQYALNSLARYVLWARNPPNLGGWPIYNLGPIPEGMVTLFAGLLSVGLVARLIGERLT